MSNEVDQRRVRLVVFDGETDVGSPWAIPRVSACGSLPLRAVLDAVWQGLPLLAGNEHHRRMLAPPNEGMKLTKLSAAPFRDKKCRLMPAPSRLDAGTASQLIPGVRPTVGRREDGQGRRLGARRSSPGHSRG
jgi:hypothetical protein